MLTNGKLLRSLQYISVICGEMVGSKLQNKCIYQKFTLINPNEMFCHINNFLLPLSDICHPTVKVLYFLMKFGKEIEMILGNFSEKYLKDPRTKISFFKITSELNITKIFFPTFAVCGSKCLHQFPKQDFISCKDIGESLHADAPKTLSKSFLSVCYFSIYIGTKSNCIKKKNPGKPFPS